MPVATFNPPRRPREPNVYFFESRKMASNSAFASGITLNRDWRSNATPASSGSALISSSPTGRFKAPAGFKSTHDQSPSCAVGSGYASRATSATPTTHLPSTLW